MYWIDRIKLPSGYSFFKNEFYSLYPNIQILNKCVPFDMMAFITCQMGEYSMGLNLESLSMASQWYIQENFKRYKQVYILNSKLFSRLKETKNIENISCNVINNLPFDSFYIEADNCDVLIDSKIPVNGMFVNIEKIIKDGKSYNGLHCILRMANNTFFPLRIDLSKDKTSIISSFNECWHMGRTLTENETNVQAEIKKTFVDFLQVVLYMCCERKDIVKLIKNPRKKGKKRQKEIIYSQLGFKIGKEILEEERRTNSEFVIGKTFSNVLVHYSYDSNLEKKTINKEEENNRPKAPHFRAAHWAVYHVGKGREQTILKWINTIYVNADKVQKTPITLHNMR